MTENENSYRQYSLETQAIHVGQDPDKWYMQSKYFH
jgi:hypothetical protein